MITLKDTMEREQERMASFFREESDKQIEREHIADHDSRLLTAVCEMIGGINFGAGLSTNDEQNNDYERGYYGGVHDTKVQIAHLIKSSLLQDKK